MTTMASAWQDRIMEITNAIRNAGVESSDVSAAQTGSAALSTHPRKNPELLARLVIRDGKPFVHSALECGYSRATAAKGQRALCRSSAAAARAFSRESTALMRDMSLDKLKPHAVARLFKEITDHDSALGLKAIELAGRFKETDWFVRAADVQIGIFAALAEAPALQKVPDSYDSE